MTIEIDTSDIQAWASGDVNLQDIQDYVEASTPSSRKQEKAGNSQYFVVSQSDFIEYRIAKRDSESKARKRSLFWLWLKKLLSWCFGVIFTIIALCLIIFGFCSLVWYIQTVLVGYNHGL